MHGYIMEYKHYEALRSVVEPTEIATAKKKASDKFDKLKEDRIILNKLVPRVNKEYIKDLLHKPAKEHKKNVCCGPLVGRSQQHPDR